jgi:hypothetical protein
MPFSAVLAGEQFLPHDLRMNKIIPLLAALLMAGPLFAENSADILSVAQRELIAGNVAAAKTKFEAVLKVDPENPTARGYLRTIQAQEAREAAAGQTMQVKLDRLTLEKVDFKEATFGSVIEFLKQQAAKQDVPINFVPRVGPEKMAAPVTLSLRTVPFLEVLRYACNLSGTDFTVEKHAVVITAAE